MSWSALLERYEKLQLRERVLVILSTVAIIYLISEFVVFGPLSQAIERAEVQEQQAKQLLAAATQEQLLLTQALKGDPDATLKNDLRALRVQQSGMNQRLSELSVDLIAVERLPMILEDVLKQSTGLQLLKIETLAVTELNLETTETASANKPTGKESQSEPQLAPSIGVFKQAVRLKLKGNYFSVVDYLDRLESLSWRFYWDKIVYNTTTYPDAEVILDVYTLATGEGVFVE